MDTDNIVLKLSGRAVYKAVREYMAGSPELSAAIESAISRYIENALGTNPKMNAMVRAAIAASIDKMIAERLAELKENVGYVVDKAIAKRLTPAIIKEALKNLTK